MTTLDFRPTASIKNLKRRSEVINEVRVFFESHGYFHVETPILSQDTVVDRYIEPIPVKTKSITEQKNLPERYWLQTSPEFGMKRLVASGAEAIYQICRAFRAGEVGKKHNPEFTMLEWYRVGQSMDEAMQFLGEFASTILNRMPAQHITYQEAFESFADIDPHQATIKDLKNAVKGQGIKLGKDQDSESMDRDGWLNLILGCVVEPNLGLERPTIIYDWPATQSALAIVRDDDVPVAERFELYVDGIELANGYHELLDADELRLRNKANNDLRIADGTKALPSESRLLEAMRSGMPDCCGVAMGVDRLIMVALAANSVEEVIAFPFDRA